MKIRGHGNAVAIALAGLAVVLAATGTAYAVTATTVNIADPNTPSRIAAVDSSGRLTTVGVASTLDVSTTIAFDTASAITSPTTASLAITSLSYSNPQLNSGFSATNYQVSFVKMTTGTAGNCIAGSAGVSVERVLGVRYLEPGDDLEMTFPSPLIVKATGSAKYCLGLVYFHIGGGTQTSLYSSAVQLTGYVSSGTYTGIGTAATPAVITAPKLLTR